MTAEPDSASDAAALLTALSGLSGVDHGMIRKAQQAMAEAMAIGAEHQALMERQWEIMQATADAVRAGSERTGANEISLSPNQQLAQARACFDVAVDAIRTLGEAAGSGGDASSDQVVIRFRQELARISDACNN